MITFGMSHLVHGIERFLELMPEPLVLRALQPSADLENGPSL